MQVDDQNFIGHGSGVDAMLAVNTATNAGRRDGRSLLEMRPVTATLAWISQPDGSARIQLRQTDVTASVYGPTECPMSKQDSQKLHIHVTFRRRDTTPTTDLNNSSTREAVARNDLQKLLQQIVLTVLHPRKALIVNVHVLHDDGAVLAAATNATILALLDAGVSMQSVPTAACVSLKNDALFVDPLRTEENEADAIFTFIFDSSLQSQGGFMSVFTEGDCAGSKTFKAAENLSRKIAHNTHQLLKQSIAKKSTRMHTWSQNILST